ncbi:MAG: insulinase family protein [Gammaproteobacteria bacterium]|nr:insulinase family protein [Gammaproteobacteria bacterium]
MKKYLLGCVCLCLGLTAKAGVLDIQHWQTNTGIPVLFVQNTHLPLLDVRVVFRAGSMEDGNTPGIALMTASMLNQGTQDRTADGIADGFADTGAQFNIDVNQDEAVIELKTLSLSEELKPAMGLFTDVLGRAVFPSESLDRLKAKQLQMITYSAQDPAMAARNQFFEMAYGKAPYGHPVEGTQSSVSAMTSDQLNAFYHQYYVSQNASIVLVGDVNIDTAKELAEEISSSLATGTPAPLPADSPNANPGQSVTIPMSTEQSTVMMGLPALKVGDPRFFAAQIGNYILGGSQLSRLYQQVRVDNGLSYGVSSDFETLLLPGPFIMTAQTRNADVQQTQMIMQSVLARFLNDGPTSSEVNAAKDYLIGHFPLILNSDTAVADALVKMAFYHLPLDYLDTYIDHVRAVTQDQVKQVMNSLIDPNSLVTVIVGGP